MSRNIKSNQAGIAHLGLVLVVLVFVAVGSLVYWRFSSSNKSQDTNVTQVQGSTDEEKLQSELENSADNLDENSNATADVAESAGGQNE